MIRSIRHDIVDTYRDYEFKRPSVAQCMDGFQVGVNNARFEPGKFGNGVMVEEGTTNLIKWTEDLSNAVWKKPAQAQASLSLTVLTPGGKDYAWVIMDNDTVNGDNPLSQRVNIPADTVNRTCSCCVKKGQADITFLNIHYGSGETEIFTEARLNWDTMTLYKRTRPASIADSAEIGIKSVGDGWFQVWVSMPNDGTQTSVAFDLYPVGWSEGGVNQGYVYFCWPQLEEKAYATSYVKSTSLPGVRANERLILKTYEENSANPTNLLTKNQSDVETDLTGFSSYNGGVGTVNFVRDATASFQGGASVKLTRLTGTGFIQINTYNGKTPVTAGLLYCANVMAKALVSAGRNWLIRLSWYDTALNQLSESLGPLSAASSDWTRLSIAAVAPVGATQVSVAVTLMDALVDETLYIDCLQLEKVDLTPCPWTVGGNVPNLLTANQSNVETDLTGLISALNNGSASTLTRDTMEKWQGIASVKVVAVGDAADQGLLNSPYLDVTPGKVYCMSAYVKAPAGTAMRLLLNERDVGNTIIGSEITNFVANGAWQRVSVSRLITTGVKLSFKVLAPDNTAITFYVDGLQLEEIVTLRGWVPGQAKRLIDPAMGTIEMWCQNNEMTRRAGDWNAFFRIDRLNNVGGPIGFTIRRNTNGLSMTGSLFSDANLSSEQSFLNTEITEGMFLIQMKWRPEKLWLNVNNTIPKTVDNPYCSTGFKQTAYIGDNGSGSMPNSIYDDLRISDTYRSDEELTAPTVLTQPSARDEYTVYKLPFDRPDGQRAAGVSVVGGR